MGIGLSQLHRDNGARLLVLAVCASALALTAGCKSKRNSKPKISVTPTEVTRVFTPEWYEETPRRDDGLFVETSQALGVTPSLSESIAINIARQRLATTIESRVDALQRNFQEELDTSVGPDLLQRFQNINAIVTSRTIYGSHVVRKETYLEGDQYRTFVLLELDGREIDSAYLDNLKEYEELETRLRSSEAWAELERRARELREERQRGRNRSPMTDREIRSGG